MLPSPDSQITIDGSTIAAIGQRCSRSDPSIDDQTSARVELVWLTSRIERVEGVQQGGGRDLSGMLRGRPRPTRETGGLGREDREAIRHCEGEVEDDSGRDETSSLGRYQRIGRGVVC